MSNNTAQLRGGGIYNGVRGTLTTTGVAGTNTQLRITGNTAGNTLSLFNAGRGRGIAAVNSTATTLTQTTVTTNHAVGLLGLFGTAGGVYRVNGTMITTDSPISANTPNNCVGQHPSGTQLHRLTAAQQTADARRSLT